MRNKLLPFYHFITLALLLFGSCATYKPQQAPVTSVHIPPDSRLKHTVFIAGGFGNGADPVLSAKLASRLAGSGESSTLIYTGDNVSPHLGLWEKDRELLNRQIELARNFKGQTIFLPGNNEWKDFDAGKMEKAEEYLKDLDLDGFEVLPENACPIEHRVINEQLDLILVDSYWFLSNWSRVKEINRKCSNILTRRRFLEELEGYINDGQGKNIIIAMHHPVYSNGAYAGKESFKAHMSPVPVVGSLLTLGSELGAFSPELFHSRRYNYLRILVTALAKASDRIVVLSGHEESLQYLEGGGISQIISGSLSQATATRLSKDQITTVGGSLPFEGVFTYGEKGFAQIEYFVDGSSRLTFFASGGQEFRYPLQKPLEIPTYNSSFTEVNNKYRDDSVLEAGGYEEKTGFYKFLWGERYREYFGKEVTAPVAMLDTLYGGLTVTKKGGGHQSYSIRLEDSIGRNTPCVH